MQNFILFFLLVALGVLIEDFACKIHYKLTKRHFKSHNFTWSKYIFLLISPIVAMIFVATRTKMPVITIFFVFSIVGTLLEYLIGFSYHQIIGTRLWTYHSYSIGKYTSWLSVPIWGFGGVLFWILAKVFE